MRSQWSPLSYACVFAVLYVQPTQSIAAEPGLVRDFPIRSMGTLQIRNQRGSVQVTSWTLDKIRVEAVRRPGADTSGPPLLPEIRFKDLGGGQMELFADYGRGLGIYDKVKELKREDIWKDGVDLLVKAPSKLGLRLLVKDGAILVKQWSASIESRSQTGTQVFEDIRDGELRVFCPSCSVTVRESRADLRLLGGDKPIQLSQIDAKAIFAETTTGSIGLDQISGEQTYVTQDGAIQGKSLEGTVQFETQKGAVSIDKVSGHVHGRTQFGNIALGIDLWKGEKGMIESQVGNIAIEVPTALFDKITGQLQATSAKGEVRITRQKKRK